MVVSWGLLGRRGEGCDGLEVDGLEVGVSFTFFVEDVGEGVIGVVVFRVFECSP